MIKKDANLYILRLASLFLFFEFIFEDGVRLLESFIVNYKLNNLEICFFIQHLIHLQWKYLVQKYLHCIRKGHQ